MKIQMKPQPVYKRRGGKFAYLLLGWPPPFAHEIGTYICYYTHSLLVCIPSFISHFPFARKAYRVHILLASMFAADSECLCALPFQYANFPLRNSSNASARDFGFSYATSVRSSSRQHFSSVFGSSVWKRRRTISASRVSLASSLGGWTRKHSWISFAQFLHTNKRSFSFDLQGVTAGTLCHSILEDLSIVCCCRMCNFIWRIIISANTANDYFMLAHVLALITFACICFLPSIIQSKQIFSNVVAADDACGKHIHTRQP